MKKMKYDNLGVMLDMSRNAIMSVEALKKYFEVLNKMGYNCAMLYTEDTYEVDGEPFFGYMRGRYTKEELRELDDYAYGLGIELIPCIQTLAHLGSITRWNKIPMDSGPVLLIDNDRTYEFIDHAFSTVSSCFRTKKIHIGMDEAVMLGRGKHLDEHGYEKTSELMKRHLAKVCEIAAKYDFEPLMWSDMFFTMMGGWCRIPATTMPDYVKEALPSHVAPVYWDYYAGKEEDFAGMLYNHQQISDKTWFAGGAWSWRGFLPNNKWSIHNMRMAMDACRKYKTKNIIMTMWGDDGGECSRYATLSTLFFISEYVKGHDDMDKIRAKFKRMFGVEFEEFNNLDDANFLHKKDFKDWNQSCAKAYFFQDYFNGYLDANYNPENTPYLEECAKKLHATAKKSRKWAYMFDSAAKLCDVLAIKYSLGVKTREAYKKGDKAELMRLAKEEYTVVLKLINEFHRAFEKQWFIENKPSGFDVQDIRIGGLIKRTESCRRRLIDYASGKYNSIPELEEELLSLVEPNGKLHTISNYNKYQWQATCNNI
ncbi:MAG: beta-N-acetylhexosaminidase [Clostridia bacterium]|nr:beta-N-acetylhexosaminidase [Clostridia bacterium]